MRNIKFGCNLFPGEITKDEGEFQNNNFKNRRINEYIT